MIQVPLILGVINARAPYIYTYNVALCRHVCVCVCRRGKRRIGDNYRLKCVHAGGLGIWEGGDHCELK